MPILFFILNTVLFTPRYYANHAFILQRHPFLIVARLPVSSIGLK